MKVLKFLSAFLAVALLIFAVIIGLNWTAFKAMFSEPEFFAEGSEWVEKTYSLTGLSEFIYEAPEFLSLASINLDDPQDTILIHADKPRVFGNLYGIFYMMELERQIHTGERSGEELVSLDDIQLFKVPSWYRSRHRQAVSAVAAGADSISVQDAITLATRYNNQAAADFLYFYFGAPNMDALIDSLGNGEIERYAPVAGIQSAIFLRPEGQSWNEAVDSLRAMDRTAFQREMREIAQGFAFDEEKRSLIKDSATPLRQRLLSNEHRTHKLFSRGSAYRLAGITAKIFSGDYISAEASARIMELMNWPASDPVVRSHIHDYGALYEERHGILNGIDFGTSVYTDQRIVQVMLFNDLPNAMWMHMASNYMSQDYQRRLIYDPELRNLTRRGSESAFLP